MRPTEVVVKYRAVKVGKDGEADVEVPAFDKDFGGVDFDSLEALAEHYRRYCDGYRKLKGEQFVHPLMYAYKVTYQPIAPVNQETHAHITHAPAAAEGERQPGPDSAAGAHGSGPQAGAGGGSAGGVEAQGGQPEPEEEAFDAHGYATEPIEGDNPCRRCVHCKRSDPHINGQVDRHYHSCEWRRAVELGVIAKHQELPKDHAFDLGMWQYDAARGYHRWTDPKCPPHLAEAMPYLTTLSAKVKATSSIWGVVGLLSEALGAEAGKHVEKLLCKEANY